MTEKIVSNIAIRIWLDSTELIMGANGLKALLNYSGMKHLLENLPDYSFDKNYTEDDFSALAANYQQVLGTQGLKAIMRQIGKTSARTSIDMGVYDSFKELPPMERFFKAAELFSIASGRGGPLMEGEIVVYDNPQCTACRGITSDTPVCTIMCGVMDELIAWAGMDGMKMVETHCKAMGDDTCRYEVRAGEQRPKRV